MKKFLLLLMSVFMIASLIACGDAPSDPEPSQADSPVDSEETSVDYDDPRLDLIVVDQTVDTITSQSVVTVKNNSNCVFSGMVHVWFTANDGSQIGSDSIIVDSLAPGRDTFARIALDSTESVSGAYEFGLCSFEEVPQKESTSLVDDDLSDQLAAAFEDSFGGAGTPEYATSWYKYLVSVSVCTSDSGNRAVATVTPGDQDGIEMICKSLFWNFSDEYNLLSVEAVSESGESLFLFSA